MSLSKLPSGRWRAQVHDAKTGKNRSVGTFDTKAEAKAARERARSEAAASQVTVAEWRETWLSDPLYARPKESTMIHNRERTKAFVATHGSLALADVTDEVVAQWIAGGKNKTTVPVLSAMWNDAKGPRAGRIVTVNPWSGLGLKKTRGNADKPPPPEDVVAELIAAADEVCSPSLAAWITVAGYTGMRPGELDALRWDAVDFETGAILVLEQWSAASKSFTLPKNGKVRVAVLTPPARRALLALPRDAEWVFTNLRGGHWTSSARAYHWKAIRAAVGYTGTLYLATRHFAGWYMTNELDLPSEDVAIALGHTDGGDQVRKLYGHREEKRARDRVLHAYESALVAGGHREFAAA